MTAARDILVCDDEPELLEALAEYLDVFDWRVRTAPGAELALQLLADGLRPGLLLTDIRMPGMDGAALIRAVGQKLPADLRPKGLVAMTGHQNDDEAVELRAAGADCVLFKPIDLETLPAMLDELLARGLARNPGGRDG